MTGSARSSQRCMGNTSCKNWVKASSLLRMCEKSEWHLAAVEERALSLSTQHADFSSERRRKDEN